MVPFVLPVVLQIAEEASSPDFVQYILPDLKPVMKLTDPIQVFTLSVFVKLIISPYTWFIRN
jgi:SCY1-like protein 2